MLRRGHLVTRGRQGPASLAARGRVLPARTAPGGPRPDHDQPPGRGARSPRRAGRRASARRARAHRRTAALEPIRRYGRLQEQQYLPLAIDVAAALHYFRHIGVDSPRHQAEQRHHGRPRASDRPVGGPSRGGREAPAPPDRHRRLHGARAVRPGGARARPADRCRRTPPTCGASAPRSSTRSRVAAPFEHGDPTPTTYADDSRSFAEAPAALPDDVPPVVAGTILACLRPDPADRPRPHQVAEALEPVLASLPRGSLAGFRIRG